MNEETTKLIEQLAQKLGTTAEYLWRVLIKQAPISAATDLLYLVLIIITGIVLFNIHKRLAKEDEHGDSAYFTFEEGAAVPMIIGVIIWGILFIVCFFSIGDIINGFLNPEYWALNNVLNAAK